MALIYLIYKQIQFTVLLNIILKVIDGFEETDLPVQLFWEVLEDFTLQQRENFLMFVTGCSRPPLLVNFTLKSLLNRAFNI